MSNRNVGKQISAKLPPILCSDIDQKNSIMLEVLRNQVADLTQKNVELDSFNRSLKKQSNLIIQDDNDIIEDIERQSLSYHTSMTSLIEETKDIRKSKDQRIVNLSAKVAHYEEKLLLAEKEISNLKSSQKKYADFSVQGKELQIENSALQVRERIEYSMITFLCRGRFIC